MKRSFACLVAVALMAALVPLAATSASARGKGTERWSTGEGIYVPDYVRQNRDVGLTTKGLSRRQAAAAQQRINDPARIGQKRFWLAIDDTSAEAPIYIKKYRLRDRSRHAEVWTAADRDEVSSGLKFPEGDCRNDALERIRVTDEKVAYFLRQFERKMWPRETNRFSTPPKRNGESAQLDNILRSLDIPAGRDYYKGKGRRVVILIDNVRDDNFFDTDNANTLSRIAGFHFSTFNELTDRNVMSIDSFNWLGNTGAEPPHSPSTDPCLNYPANPFGYEGVFAHEFEHLLEYYADPDGEFSWVDEGMADWAQTLTGYVQPWQPIDNVRYDSHIQCFLGYLEQTTEYNPIPADNCGPENSLTAWEDQTDNEIEILADYGAAYSMMEMLVDRYGKDSMTFLHNEILDGFEGLAAMLANQGATITPLETVHEWLLVMAVDKLLDGGAALTGSTSDLEVTTLNAMVDWSNDDAFMSPGAPPNGGDYVQARKNNGQFLAASDINRITFDGAETLPPDPVEWVVDTTKREGNPSLYSGSGPNFDRAIVEEAAVPATNATLTFDTFYEMEDLYDYGFVQVSTDNGETWTSLANEHTTTEIASDSPIRTLLEDEVPGFTEISGGGEEGAWVTESFDMTPYAGQTVLLSFRYITDAGVDLPGWWIDNVQVGTTVVSDGNDLADWRSATQINPIDVAGFTVQLVAWTNDGTQVQVGRLTLGAGFTGTLEGPELETVIGNVAENVGIIVTYDDPTGLVSKYAPYELRVDNALQPGGE